MPATAFRPFIRTLRLMGIWWTTDVNGTNNWKNTLYAVYSKITVYWGIHIYTLGMFLFCWRQRKDLDDLINGMFLLFTNIALIYKVINWQNNYDRIRRLVVATIEDGRLNSRISTEHAFVLLARHRLYRTVLLFVVGTIGGIGFWMLSPFMSGLDGGVAEEGHTGFGYQLPIPMYFFFEIVGKPTNYAIMYIFQFIGLPLAASMNLSVDGIAVGLMSMASAQISILGERMERVGYEGNGAVGGKRRGELQDWSAELKRLTVLYVETVGFVREIQNCFGEALFFQLFCTSVMMCVTGYQLLSMPLLSTKAVALISYVAVINWQLYSYCWMGNEIIHLSDKLSTQLYSCNFVVFNAYTVRNFRVLLQMVQRPLGVSAIGLFEVRLCLATYISVMKAAYSNLMVLHSMDVVDEVGDGGGAGMAPTM